LLQRTGLKPILQGGEERKPKAPDQDTRQTFKPIGKGAREMKKTLLILAATLAVVALAQAAPVMVLFEEWTNNG
jgi:hypothetical protein